LIKTLCFIGMVAQGTEPEIVIWIPGFLTTKGIFLCLEPIKQVASKILPMGNSQAASGKMQMPACWKIYPYIKHAIWAGIVTQHSLGIWPILTRMWSWKRIFLFPICRPDEPAKLWSSNQSYSNTFLDSKWLHAGARWRDDHFNYEKCNPK
jgi:hypothetical protein